MNFNYTPSLTAYKRRTTRTVMIGDIPLGSDYPIRIQSMTTTDTMDTIKTVEQSIRMIDAGCEFVRITAPSINEARNLEQIKKELRNRGYNAPLIADIHFTPNAAEMAARIVEKVRINPGNYVDKKKFENIEYTDIEYHAELDRIRERFLPLVKICKEYGTAMRIGTNHGSLSDRIMSRYGDTPLGMVESAMEFLQICRDENYHQIVLSMKASNAQVMVQAYRLLVAKMNLEGMDYPLHVGVTEAGDGEDGRTKSAVGIGCLLEDGIGDTVRVSLTEDPEFEAPVAIALVNRYNERAIEKPISIDLSKDESINQAFSPYEYKKRTSIEIENIGGTQVPRVVSDMSHLSEITEFDLQQCGHIYDAKLDKWHMNDQGADYVYLGNIQPSFMLPNGLKAIVDIDTWQKLSNAKNIYPYFNHISLFKPNIECPLNFVLTTINDLTLPAIDTLKQYQNCVVLVLKPTSANVVKELRQLFWLLMKHNITLPVIIQNHYPTQNNDTLVLHASTDIGSLFIDGFGDGIWLGSSQSSISNSNRLAFGILQACRCRISKTEYISCPSCGRTLFDLQDTTAMIRKRTDHLKGVKIAIMGCIVNGPGEMADADYGYVGSGVDKITLYRNKDVVKRNLPSSVAVDELIALIAEDGNWIEKEQN
jgi:(E)-4-hydroxy-3-methylbut-2-enyl-diphosphate synthase